MERVLTSGNQAATIKSPAIMFQITSVMAFSRPRVIAQSRVTRYHIMGGMDFPWKIRGTTRSRATWLRTIHLAVFICQIVAIIR